MFDGLVSRIPIYNRALDVYGYELKLCSGDAWMSGGSDDVQAFGECLIRASGELPLEHLVGNRISLIRLPADLLPRCEEIIWPRDRLLFALPETAMGDHVSAEMMGKLAAQGFRIAVDNPSRDLAAFQRDARFIALCSLQANASTGLMSLRGQALPRDRPHLLVRELETADQYDYFHRLGVDYYEGSFFIHPRLIHGTEVPADRLSALQLLGHLQDPEVDIRQVEELVRNDITLSYKLLRLINSAFFGIPRQVESIKRAVVFFGLQRIKNWVSVVLVNAIEFRPRELMTMALVRARTCELIAQHLGRDATEAYYIAGLFSLLDAIMDAPMAFILERLNLHDTVTEALLHGSGPIGDVLQCVLAIERGDFPAVYSLSLGREALPLQSYLAAIAFAAETNTHLQ